MSTVVAEIEAKIRSLSLEDKNELIRALIAELDGPSDAGVAFVFVGGPPPGRSAFSELTQCEPTATPNASSSPAATASWAPASANAC